MPESCAYVKEIKIAIGDDVLSSSLFCIVNLHFGKFGPCPGALCVQMDFTRTFEANTMCNNMNHVWSHFYKILVVLRYHRRLWVNIFDTDISRCINIYIKVVYLALFGIFMLLQMSVLKILSHRRLWYFQITKIL